MRKVTRVMYAAILTGMAFGGCFPNCCDLSLPNLGKCFSAEPCTLLLTLLGGIGGA